MVLIKGKTLNHKIHEINVDPETKISTVKEKFSEVLENKLNMYDYKLIHLGKVLNDDDVITEEHDSKLFIIMTTKKKPEDIKPVQAEPAPAGAAAASNLNTKFTFKSTSTSTITNGPAHNPPQTISSNVSLSGSGQNIANLLNSMLSNNQSMTGEMALLSALFSNPNLLGLSGLDPSNNLLSALSNLGVENDEDDEVDHEGDHEGDNEEDNHDEDEHHDNENEEEDHDNEDNIPTPVLNAHNNDTSFNTTMIGNFSQKDIDNVNEIVEMGFDYYEVIQMYTASGKDKETAINLLFENH
jgi:hypothetical protein